MNKRISVLVMAMIVTSGALIAAIPTMTNTGFAEKCKDTSDGFKCSGKGTLGGQGGSFKCDFGDDECSFSGSLSQGKGGKCTGDLLGPKECKGNLEPGDF